MQAMKESLFVSNLTLYYRIDKVISSVIRHLSEHITVFWCILKDNRDSGLPRQQKFKSVSPLPDSLGEMPHDSLSLEESSHQN